MGDLPLVLIVDEDHNFTRILEAKLRLSGFDVTIAEDLASASAALRSRHFSLVLLDVRLPDGSGLDSLKDLRELSPKTIFVIVTAYEEELLRERALVSGARDVLYKPFDLELLIHTIHRLLSHDGGTSSIGTEAVVHMIVPGQTILVESSDKKHSTQAPAIVTNKRYDSFDISGESLSELRAGMHVRVSVSGDDGLYQFQSTVTTTGSDPESASLAQPTVIRRRQRRRHARMNVNANAHVVVNRPRQTEVQDKPPKLTQDSRSTMVVEAIVTDVSKSGFGMSSPAPIPTGALVHAECDLPALEPSHIQLTGKAVRCEPDLREMDEPSYRIGVAISGLREDDSEKLNAFLIASGCV